MPAELDIRNGHAQSSMGRYLLARELAFLGESLRGRSGRVLEVGCGTGLVTQFLEASGFEVVGVDVDASALKTCRLRCPGSLQVQASATRLPVASDSFDTIVAIETLGFFPYGSFFDEGRRILRPRGLLVFDSFNNASYRSKLRRALGRRLTQRMKHAVEGVGVAPEKHPAEATVSASFDEVISLLSAREFKMIAASGYQWLPFDVRAETRLVEPLAQLERLMRLDRYQRLSPAFLVAAQKGAAGRFEV